MDEKIISAWINDQAVWIRSQIEGGTLYGRQVDMNNEDAVLLAAYLLGQSKEMELHRGDLERLELLK